MLQYNPYIYCLNNNDKSSWSWTGQKLAEHNLYPEAKLQTLDNDCIAEPTKQSYSWIFLHFYEYLKVMIISP